MTRGAGCADPAGPCLAGADQGALLRAPILVAAVALGLATTAPAQPQLETVAELQQAPGNVTLTPEGRVILSLHQMYTPAVQVVELLPDGSLRTFPNPEWNRTDGDADSRLDAVLGVQSDLEGVVWMLDNGRRTGVTPKLVGWDTRAGELRAVIPLPPPVTVPGSFLNDLAVDSSRRTVYIADPAQGPDAALIVVDLTAGTARRLLQGHSSVVPEDVALVVAGEEVRFPLPGGRFAPVRVGVDSIALDHDATWLYFGPLSGTTLYRVGTEVLRDVSLDASTLATRVQRFARKPASDGLSTDAAGNVYVTDVGHAAIGVITSGGDWGRLVQDAARLSWPDALAFGPDGWIYAVSNQLHLSPPFNGGDDRSRPPYYLVRFRPLLPGIVGR